MTERVEYPTDAIPDEGIQPLGDPVEDEVAEVIAPGEDTDEPADQGEPEDIEEDG